MRKRDEYGQFKQKSNEPREVRSIRLTNSTWEKLGEIAQTAGVTRADIIEAMFETNTSVQKFSKAEVKNLVEEILSDQEVTRTGKDRGSVKRGLEALLQKLPE
ncbi:hypothetical protein BV372_12250 [Nostoc sp. T09]|uniref:hypothetical protein n=1 Tax=Nostoc sp. T09 TaxID=1932621 RepID=UPI000A3C2DD0|nr:hypothetical protein [Nostoc sp. T09]OUL35118.1 hypothetical protein BV372_12250 [Nostoc sp. T09]